jgi:TolA-binding protein
MKRYRKSSVCRPFWSGWFLSGCAWLVSLSVIFAVVVGLSAAVNEDEQQLFNAAAKAFNDGFYERAERELGEFIRLYPQSELVSEAILYQAQARFKLSRLEGVLELLNSQWAQAGKWADAYRFWMAEAFYYRTNYASAAAMYSQLLKDYPDSHLRPQAAFGEALAWHKVGSLTNVVRLLQNAEGGFQQLARTQPTNDFVRRGLVLLGESLLELKDLKGAEQILSSLPAEGLASEVEWQRQSLLLSLRLMQNQPEAALGHVTNLLRLAERPELQRLRPTATVRHADILERTGNPAAAIQVLKQNLADTVPNEHRRQALLKTVALHRQIGQIGAAGSALTVLIRQFPNDPEQDRWRLDYGGNLLQQGRMIIAPDSTSTNWIAKSNLLQQALVQYEGIVARYTNSPWLGQAHLGRGWCFWEAERWRESQAAFQTAVRLLPAGEDRAQAWFKWADTQYRLDDFNGAATNYQQLAAAVISSTPPNHRLAQQAMYQLIRVEVDRKDVTRTTAAMKEMLSRYPTNEYVDRVLLLAGQLHNREGRSAEARGYLEDLTNRFPASALVPSARLALTTTLSQEGSWSNALDQIEQWIKTYTNHPALPEAEFRRGWIHDQAGRGTNALSIFTNYVVRFATHPLAPQVQNWIGDYYYNLGQYPRAEENYQLLYQKWPESDLAFKARLMAGRAAFLRQGFDDAIGYFTNMINDVHCPVPLVAQAFFNMGEAYMNRPSTNLAARYELAINAFQIIPRNYATNRLAPLAWGKIGDCYLQLAAMDTNQYANASQSYSLVLKSLLADWPTRCQAEVGLAIVNEKLASVRPDPEKSALMHSALDHYLNVLYEKTRGTNEPHSAFWLEKAGLEAARLAEKSAQPGEAERIYRRLEEVLPALHSVWDRRREAALKAVGSADEKQPKTDGR